MDSSETTPCPFCEAPIGASAKKCRHCAEWVARSCEACGTPVRGEWAARGLCAECQARRGVPAVRQDGAVVASGKNRGVATLVAVLFGGLGFHKFYLGSPIAGIIYLVFFWTFIPSLLGLMEGVWYAFMDEAEFQRRYSS